MSELELIWVEPRDKRKVGLIEEHDAHPGGIAQIVGDAIEPDGVDPVRVARTPRVQQAIAKSAIIVVDTPKTRRGRKPKQEELATEEGGEE